MTKYDKSLGIVINKIPYNDYHEILNILDENGKIYSYFYENVNKNKKKTKVIIPSKIETIYYKTSGMRKIVSLDIDNYYKTISYDIVLISYISYILELVSISEENYNYYKILNEILNLVDEKKIDIKLAIIYFSIHFLQKNGFIFRYKKTNNYYTGYSYKDDMFIDEKKDSSYYSLQDKLIKIIYLLSINNEEILEKIYLENKEYNKIFYLTNSILVEYLGIKINAYNKIVDIENFNGFFIGEENG